LLCDLLSPKMTCERFFASSCHFEDPAEGGAVGSAFDSRRGHETLGNLIIW
jgi:hypothetical protein